MKKFHSRTIDALTGGTGENRHHCNAAYVDVVLDDDDSSVVVVVVVVVDIIITITIICSQDVR